MLNRTLFIIGLILVLFTLVWLLLFAIKIQSPAPLPTPVTQAYAFTYTSPSAEESSYQEVKYGDTLPIIGERYGVSPAAIASTNDISANSFVQPGEILEIPPAAEGFYYETQEGETLQQIAEKFGIPDYAIAKMNGITNPDMIQPGLFLFIPPSTTPPPPLPTPTPPPPTIVKVQWPGKLEINNSAFIRVSVSHAVTSTTHTEPNGTEESTDTIPPVGTPSAPIEHAFGSSYEGFATANLAGIAFESQTLTGEIQSLDQPTITWVWSIIPKKPGTHLVNLSIEGEWHLINGEGRAIKRELWHTSESLKIVVEEPWIVWGQFQFVGLLGTIGAGLVLPQLNDALKARRAKKPE